MYKVINNFYGNTVNGFKTVAEAKNYIEHHAIQSGHSFSIYKGNKFYGNYRWNQISEKLIGWRS